jgi:hypothetical protein
MRFKSSTLALALRESMDLSIRSQLASPGSMIGHACTGKAIGAEPPPEEEPVVAWRDVWELAQNLPALRSSKRNRRTSDSLS